MVFVWFAPQYRCRVIARRCSYDSDDDAKLETEEDGGERESQTEDGLWYNLKKRISIPSSAMVVKESEQHRVNVAQEVVL